MSRPLISIVTATYNSADLLQRCIDSVANQTFDAVEHIIIDGASTDGTIDIIKANQDKLAYWVSEPDTGIYNAWNKAVPHIKGEWVLFLGSDDRLAADHTLQEIAPFLKTAFPLFRLVYGIILNTMRWTDEVFSKEGIPWEKTKKMFRKAGLAIPPHSSTFHHISIFGEGKRFDETYRICADYKFIIIETLEMDPLFIPINVTCFSKGGLSNCIGKNELEVWKEDFNISKELNLKVPNFILAKNFLKALCIEIIYSLSGGFGAAFVGDIYRIILKKKPIYLKGLRGRKS